MYVRYAVTSLKTIVHVIVLRKKQNSSYSEYNITMKNKPKPKIFTKASS